MGVIEQGIEGWRRFFLPSNRVLLEWEFTGQGLELPPPKLLEKMVGIDHTDWENMASVLAVFWGAVPPARGRFFVPIHQLMSTQRTLNKMLDMLKDDQPGQLLKTIWQNAKELSEARGHKTTMHPHEFAGSTEELLRGFVRKTPFYELFHHGVNYEFPLAERKVHTMFVASSRSGKSYAIESQVLEDAKNGYACIVIDPKDDPNGLYKRLPMHKSLQDRMVYIDPDECPGINIFDIEGDFEQVFDSYEYFFSSILEDDLSPQMKTVLRNLTALMTCVPKANLSTLLVASKDVNKFKEYFPKLEAPVRDFLEKDFARPKDNPLNKTKDALNIRIRGMQAGKFGRMFMASQNMIKLRQWIDERKIIVIHASQNKLGRTFKAFGRYFVAEAVRAARMRQTVHPCFLYVDEAHFFFDEKTEEILATMSAYNFGGVFAFQTWSQAEKAKVSEAMIGNTQVKIFGGHNDTDRANFAKTFYPDKRGSLDPMPRGKFYARIVGQKAITFEVPTITEPFMDAEEYKTFRAENRASLTSPEPEPSQEIAVVPLPSSSSDDVPLE